MALQPGAHLGPYEILAPLGAGGMGQVYRAKDPRLDREVAIKVLPERLAKDPVSLARFEREAKAVAALSHPNILAIHDVGADQGVSYAVMELLEGETLRDRLRHGALPWRKAAEIAIGIADGLAAAHGKGIVHRDLKPENIFLTTDGVVKILDFGLARMEGVTPPQDLADSPTVTMETRPGTLLGTVNYMSPEQVRGGVGPAPGRSIIDVRSDLFSFGCVLYEMVTGQRAFARETAAETMTAILHDDPADISATGKETPPELDRIIRHCLEKRSEQRCQSAHDLAFDLRAILVHSAVSRIYPPTTALRSRAPLWIAVASLVVVALAVLFVALNKDWLRSRGLQPARPTEVGRITSLAVLPLANLSGDPEQEYFADGMTEALIADLAKIGSLRVISRTSAMHYKGTKKRLPQIGRELNVDAIVEGSVLRAGDKVRITAQLIHAATDKHLWAESYERELRDILALQSEVAQAIAREIQIKLTPQEQGRLAAVRPVNPEAYQLYLKGRYHWNKRAEAGFRKAIEYFQQALDHDPSCALAYAGLADCYSLLASYGVLPPKEAYPKARTAAIRALEIDHTLAEAHASLGLIKQYDWDWSGAEKEYRQAIRLNPGYATARHWYANLLSTLGRSQEAVAQIRRAQELDPLSPIINTVAGYVFYEARQYEQGVEECRKALDLDPDFAAAHLALGEIYGQMDRHPEAIASLKRAVSLSGNAVENGALLGVGYALGGMEDEARQVLSELARRSEGSYVAPSLFGMIYVGLGEKDRAFEWFEKAYEERESYLEFLPNGPLFDPLRDDPRFDDLLRRIGLEPTRAAAWSPRGPATGHALRPDGRIMLAVLPFDDISSEPQEWFSDGMTEEMIAQLGRLQPRKLGVIARTSAMRYKDTDKRADQIGRELGVDYLLEGSVRRAGERLRITAQLIQVSDQTHLWAESYDRTIEDVFAIQADVAERIARSLEVELLPSGKAGPRQTPTANPAAHEAYLKGRYFWNKRTIADLETAIKYFERAIEKDPTYALAYSGLADTYGVLPYYRFARLADEEASARAAATRALELDDTLAEAHTSMAGVKFNDWDFAGAERCFRRAIELNPNYATAHQWYGELLSTLGRHDEAIDELCAARQLDPQSFVISFGEGACLYYARRYDEAIAELRSTLEMEPGFAWANWYLGLAYEHQGMHREAIAEYQKWLAYLGADEEVVSNFARAFDATGMEGALREWLAFLESDARRKAVSPTVYARIHARLGEVDDAFRWLEQAYKQRDPLLDRLKVDLRFDSLRGDPRFDELLRRIGLEP